MLDVGIHCRGVFINMWYALNLNYDVLTKHNHEGLTVEDLYRFL